jgi:2-polyprenyl-3-methyl-5-hydroxy-6-metoxy-1,4-benzoquinol methylase
VNSYALNIESPIELESAAWGTTRADLQDLELLADFTRLPVGACVERLRGYQLEEMAAAWRERNPVTAKEIREFYSDTDLYLWELLTWNGSNEYTPYLERLRRLADQWPPRQFPRALDYGSGVGSVALRLAELGYQVTIADVPGRTFDFAQARLKQRGISFEAIPVTSDVPALPPNYWDVITCFDVIEHVPNPATIGRVLVRALRRGGGAAIVASFDTQSSTWPHHLPAGAARFGGHRWRLFLQGLGVRLSGDCQYRKPEAIAAWLLRARYLLWKTTGLHIEYFSR